jgi:hypothetical protein
MLGGVAVAWPHAARALIAYGPNVGEMFRRLGGYVGKILQGAKPSD